MSVEDVPCNFVGSFKVGDNLVFNAEILCKLADANADGSLNKIIVLQVGSILEACLSQIIYRAQNYKKEGVPNITEADRQEIEGKKVDTFAVVIDVLKKYGVLDGLRPGIYDDLHRLRQFRNKIHIQNNVSIKDAPSDEPGLFDDKVCSWVLSLNTEVIKFLSKNFCRPEDVGNHVNPLRIPS